MPIEGMEQIMEAKFDKEMDALLRKAVGIAAPDADSFESHLDPNEISMFAENAMPDSARSRAISHFADCNQCRGILANVIALSETEQEAPVAVPVVETTTEPASSWLQNLLSVRNLAFTFGALAILFVGFLGFATFRNMNSASESEMAKAEDSRPADANEIGSISQDTNTSANATSATPEDAKENLAIDGTLEDQETLREIDPNSGKGRDVAGKDSADPSQPIESRRDIGERSAPKTDLADSGTTSDIATANEPEKPVAAAPPAPMVEKNEEPLFTTRGGTESKAASQARKKESAPAADRATGRSNTDADDEISRRTVGGKTFSKRGNTWYDIEYKGQSTVNVTRGTADYTKLDSGLRSYGSQLSGTVVVVWKSKAYKIQ